MTNLRSIGGFLDRVRPARKTVTTYGPTPDPYAELRSFLGRFDVELVHEHLPVPASAGYLTVREGDRFRGSVPAARLGDLPDPPRDSPWSHAVRTSGFRDLSSLLADTAFTSVGRPHLLATSREFEDRAWRVGEGTLYAGFQSTSAVRDQLRLYQRLAGETDLTVAVYGEPDWVPPEPTGLRVVAEADTELGDFWFVAFDGGGDDDMACALVAEEVEPGDYRGVWTYEPAPVREFAAYLDATYGSEGNG